MKKLLLLAICFLVSVYTFSQDELVDIKHSYSAGDAHMRAYNSTQAPVYIIPDFSSFGYMGYDGDLPIIKRVEPGISEFMMLMDAPRNLNYTFKWYRAHPSPKLDPKFPYLFPVKQNAKTTVFHIGYNKGFMGTDVKGKWYSLGFEMKDSKTVHGVRKGVVVKKVSNLNNSNISPEKYVPSNNLLQVMHEDGTIAEYTNFAQNAVYKEMGDMVYPGEVLGEVNTAIEGIPFIGLTIFHADIKSKYYKTIIPKFSTNDGVVKVLAPGSYVTDHPDKVKGLEMTRKEKKKFLK